MERLWIIVWEDGSLSHNLPLNLATELGDYCKLRHSLKRKSNQWTSEPAGPQKTRNPQYTDPGSSSSFQKQPPTTSPTQASTETSTQSAVANTSQPSSVQQTINSHPNILSLPITLVVAPSPIPPTVEAISAEAEVYVPPKTLLTTLRLLDPCYWSDSTEHEKISHLFRAGWKHPNKILPGIKGIFVVSLPDHLNESYREYKDLLARRNGLSGVNEQLVFHGTTRNCALGEGVESPTMCEDTSCSLCCILQTSFLVSKAGSSGRSFKRFGPGIYTSNVSSKADDYAIVPEYADHKVVVVAKVALGKSKIYAKNTKSLKAPPRGYDSIVGKVGVHLNYDEQVLSKNEAIRPAYVVVYKRPTSVST